MRPNEWMVLATIYFLAIFLFVYPSGICSFWVRLEDESKRLEAEGRCVRPPGTPSGMLLRCCMVFEKLLGLRLNMIVKRKRQRVQRSSTIGGVHAESTAGNA